jgi:hypothetical protein
MGAHPYLEVGDQRRAVLLAGGKTLLRRLAVDGALDLEQGVDPADSLERQGRDNNGLLLALRLGSRGGFNIG